MVRARDIPFDEPQGKIKGALARSLFDVDLERMGDLVTQHVIHLAKARGEWYDDA